jgi:hypothetical protein
MVPQHVKDADIAKKVPGYAPIEVVILLFLIILLIKIY